MACKPAVDENTFRLRSEEHTSELQSRSDLVCRLLLEKKKKSTRSTVSSSTQAPTQPVTQPMRPPLSMNSAGTSGLSVATCRGSIYTQRAASNRLSHPH